MCDVLLSALVAGVLYSACGVAEAQNPTCPTRPTGDSTNACASTAFVNNEIAAFAQSTTATIATLKALTAPTAQTSVYVQGYFAANDGGEGVFVYDTASTTVDDGGITIIPNSAPASGRWKRAYIADDGAVISVKWFGVKGDGTLESMTAINGALNAAVAVKGGLYFPATVNRYLIPSAIVVPDNTHGLRIFGDVAGTPVAGVGTAGSYIATTAASAIDMTAVASGGTGSISEITIDNLQLLATGASGKALKVWNVANIRMTNLIVDATNGTALDIAGTANFVFTNINLYGAGGPPLRLSVDAVGAQNVGPGSFNTVSCSSIAQAFPCISISGDPLGVTFNNTGVSWQSSTAVAAIDINGPAAGTPVGTVTFIETHTESTFNTTNTGKTFRVGATNKFGTLVLIGGSHWGHGDTVNFQQDMIQIVAARNVEINSVVASKLSAVNGFSRSMIRLEAGFPTANDSYSFTGNKADISGTLYSDANSRCTGTSDCQFGGSIINSLVLGTALPLASGGTNNSLTAVSGGLVWSDATKLNISSAATLNGVVYGGGAGVAPTFTAQGAANTVLTANAGAPSFSTNPTVTTLAATTSLTSPLHIGGSGTTGTQLTLQTTTGNGTTDQMAVNGGNNGGTRIATFLGTGKLGVGSAAGAAVPTNTTMVISQNATTVDAATTALTPLLHIVGADTTVTSVVHDAFGTIPVYAFRAAGGTAASKSALTSAQFLGGFLAYGWDGSSYGQGSEIAFLANENFDTTHHGTRISFYVVPNASTTASERLRVNASGGLSVGSTAVSTDPGDGGLVLSGATITFTNLATDATHTDRTVCQDTTSKSLFFGSGAAGICLGTSSMRYKRDIQPLTVGLTDLVKLQPKSFYYLPGYGDDGAKRQYGVVAEDVMKVIPSIVGLNDKGQPNSVDWAALTPIMVNAIIELNKEVQALKKERVNARRSQAR